MYGQFYISATVNQWDGGGMCLSHSTVFINAANLFEVHKVALHSWHSVWCVTLLCRDIHCLPVRRNKIQHVFFLVQRTAVSRHTEKPGFLCALAASGVFPLQINKKSQLLYCV